MNLLVVYGYYVIHPFDPNAQDDLEFNYQPRICQPHYVSTFQIHHTNYLDQGITKLKYTDALTPTYSEGLILSGLTHQLHKYLTMPKNFSSLN